MRNSYVEMAPRFGHLFEFNDLWTSYMFVYFTCHQPYSRPFYSFLICFD